MRGCARGIAPLVLLALATGCQSQEDYRLEVAGDVFNRYCARCHGQDAAEPRSVEGYGRAPDLRRLAERYGSPLPREELAAFVDGRHDLDEEGRAMPVWGDELYANLPDSAVVNEMRTGTIELLIDYLESIQADRD